MRQVERELRYHAARNNISAVQLILENYASVSFGCIIPSCGESHFNIDAKAYLFGNTAIEIAVKNGFADMCSLLVSYGANKNASTFFRSSTLMHMAASRGYRDVCQALMLNGVSCDAENSIGETPLLIAAKRRHYSTVAFFLQNAKAQVNKVDVNGKNAMDYAAMFDDNGMMKLLRDNGGKYSAPSKPPVLPLYKGPIINF